MIIEFCLSWAALALHFLVSIFALILSWSQCLQALLLQSQAPLMVKGHRQFDGTERWTWEREALSKFILMLRVWPCWWLHPIFFFSFLSLLIYYLWVLGKRTNADQLSSYWVLFHPFKQSLDIYKKIQMKNEEHGSLGSNIQGVVCMCMWVCVCKGWIRKRHSEVKQQMKPSLCGLVYLLFALYLQRKFLKQWFPPVSFLGKVWAFSLLRNKAHFMNEGPSQGRTELTLEPVHYRCCFCAELFYSLPGYFSDGLFIMSEHFNHLLCVCPMRIISLLISFLKSCPCFHRCA